MFDVIGNEVDAGELCESIVNRGAGAIVTFEGRVRDHNDGRRVLSLEYEVYLEMAEKEGNLVLKEALKTYGVLEIRAVHRMGHLEIGDIAVWVGVSSAHRAEAYDASRYVIDALKHRLPIWKKEAYADGSSEWINCKHCHAASVTG